MPLGADGGGMYGRVLALVSKYMRRLTPADRQRVECVIAAHLHELTPVRGFVAARAGFAVSGGRLIREPAILVFVRQKLNAEALAPRDLLPREIDGLRVDVVQTDPRTELELLNGHDDQDGQPVPAGNTRSGGVAGVAGVAPARAGTGAGGAAVADAAVAGAAVAGATVAGAAVAETPAASVAAALPVTPYAGLPGDPIDEAFTVSTPILCHVGPDTGWTVLRDFLAGTRAGLTAAMYDFNADYIERALIDVAETHGAPIVLTLDNGLMADERTLHERLRDRLAAALDAQIIVCRPGGRFPTAYHEKVAVRDGASFWLSSGNWSRSSQPEIDPLGQPDDARGMYSKGNREWHVVVNDEPLAQLFARYIRHDLDSARADATPVGVVAALPDVFVRLDDLAADFARAAAVAPIPVAPQQLPATPRPIAVRPLLSPDNYARRVDELVRSAEERLYLQYSYINWTDADHNQPFTALLEYLGELSWRDDFDLRVIVGSTDAVNKVRLLAQHACWNDVVVRSQSRVHNKGIIADGARVLVSSQNWSGDGFLRNRDAGVIIDDEEIAAYYEAVFLDDWNRRTRSPLTPGPVAIVAREGEPVPPGMVRMSWRDFYGD